jgi:hypothetical protein
MSIPTKELLFGRGALTLELFCKANSLAIPQLVVCPRHDWPFSPCAYYREGVISICVDKCAPIGTAGRSWSFPGYTVDRTPYGVIQHELGHHADRTRGNVKGKYWSEYSIQFKAAVQESALTSYEPNPAEWFAEMFRLFVTNPDLLRQLRPLTYARLIADGYKPLFGDSWQDRLADAPQRTINAAANKIAACT